MSRGLSKLGGTVARFEAEFPRENTNQKINSKLVWGFLFFFFFFCGKGVGVGMRFLLCK